MNNFRIFTGQIDGSNYPLIRANRTPFCPSFGSVLQNSSVMKKEVWKDIPSYEGIYKVSNLGRIKALPKIRKGFSYMSNKWVDRHYKSRIIKLCVGRDYLLVVLTNNGKTKTELVHRLVAKAFIPNPENKPNINHLDFNPVNNNLENLEWCTQYENIHYTMNANRDNAPKGEKNGMSKMKDSDIKDVFKLYKKGFTQRMIATYYNVHPSAISYILLRKTYKHVKIT